MPGLGEPPSPVLVPVTLLPAHHDSGTAGVTQMQAGGSVISTLMQCSIGADGLLHEPLLLNRGASAPLLPKALYARHVQEEHGQAQWWELECFRGI